jgi:DNA-binding transcriptional ArsR family regulator
MSRPEAKGAPALPEATVERLAETFAALSDPTRLRIICSLAAGEMCVCDLAATLGVSASAVSHQLRLLRNLRLVRFRRAGKAVFYALDDDHVLTLLDQGLAHVSH